MNCPTCDPIYPGARIVEDPTYGPVFAACDCMNTPTPETDAAFTRHNSPPYMFDLLREAMEKLERERDEARREAEIERDKTCHPDHGGHRFPWEKQ